MSAGEGDVNLSVAQQFVKDLTCCDLTQRFGVNKISFMIVS